MHQGKVALRSVRQSYLAAQQYADLVITTWRTNKVLNLTPSDLITCRDDAIAKLTLAHTYYSERLVWATDYRRLGQGVVTVVPLTSNVERIHPFQVLLTNAETGLARDSKAQAELLRSVDFRRVGPVAGFVPPPLLRALDDALRVHLDLR